MDAILWNSSELLLSLVAELPLTLTLIAGIVLCYSHRKRMPRTARLLGWAILVEMIWTTIGWRVVYGLKTSLGFSWQFSPDDLDNVEWLLKSTLAELPSAIISAAIWGWVLWAALMIDEEPHSGISSAATASGEVPS